MKDIRKSKRWREFTAFVSNCEPRTALEVHSKMHELWSKESSAQMIDFRNGATNPEMKLFKSTPPKK